jgi:putative NADPH-quinone reductase
MKHAIIVGHPDAKSFTMAVAETYAKAAGSTTSAPCAIFIE